MIDQAAVGEFATLLRSFRERRSLSCNELARAVGVDPSYISRLERGEREPPGAASWKAWRRRCSSVWTSKTAAGQRRLRPRDGCFAGRVGRHPAGSRRCARRSSHPTPGDGQLPQGSPIARRALAPTDDVAGLIRTIRCASRVVTARGATPLLGLDDP